MRADALLSRDFMTLAAMIAAHADERPDAIAIVDGERKTSYAALHAAINRVAASFQRDGLRPGASIAMCAGGSTDYLLVMLGAVSANVIVCPLSPSLTPVQLARMIEDCEARYLFLDSPAAAKFADALPDRGVRRVLLERESDAGLSGWLGQTEGAADVPVSPQDPFNIIYSSGTTGTPKGIVQSHVMRWRQVKMLRAYGFDAASATLLSTPLYSNTTLAGLFPTLACGGTVVLMRKFDARDFLRLSQTDGVTHAMLVPVQFRRIMDTADFDAFDLSTYVMKFAASAPFPAKLKADVLRRWPGGLVELYGATEGGGLCVLDARAHPDKLGTVGLPYPGHDIRLIRDDGTECAPGEEGEVVGRSGAMMEGYHKDPVRTAEAEWFSPAGLRYIRMGDIGRFDADGFLTIVDRKKDMIISGGFNIYPSDVEAALVAHPAVLEAAVVGIPSRQWGETPIAFVALRDGVQASEQEIAAFVEGQVGRTQRPAAFHFVAALPRSTIGKVLKQPLREQAIALAGAEA